MRRSEGRRSNGGAESGQAGTLSGDSGGQRQDRRGGGEEERRRSGGREGAHRRAPSTMPRRWSHFSLRSMRIIGDGWVYSAEKKHGRAETVGRGGWGAAAEARAGRGSLTAPARMCDSCIPVGGAAAGARLFVWVAAARECGSVGCSSQVCLLAAAWQVRGGRRASWARHLGRTFFIVVSDRFGAGLSHS